MKNPIITLILLIHITGCSSDQSENSIFSLLISKKGELVKQGYFNEQGKTDMQNVQSITKSIVSLLIGIAIEKGYIKSEETFLHEYFPEENYFATEQKKEITIKHLLNHTSGIEWNGYLEHEDFLKSSNPLKYVLEREMVASPGEEYNYNSGGAHILSIILTKATGMSTLEFAENNLFKPIGCDSIHWEKLNDGYHDGAGFSLSMHSYDLMKLGKLILNRGKLNNIQLISNEWIEKTYDESLKRNTKWGLNKSKHGYGWYSKMNGEMQILYSMGYGGQFIFIIPSDSLIITATHNHDTPNGIEQQVDFIKETFPQIMNEYGSSH